MCTDLHQPFSDASAPVAVCHRDHGKLQNFVDRKSRKEINRGLQHGENCMKSFYLVKTKHCEYSLTQCVFL